MAARNYTAMQFTVCSKCPGGGIGRRTGLKIPRWRQRAGSIPAPGTNFFQFHKVFQAS